MLTTEAGLILKTFYVPVLLTYEKPTRIKFEIRGINRAPTLDTNMSSPLVIPVIKVLSYFVIFQLEVIMS